jgi:ketosteroid isomerase-like protein
MRPAADRTDVAHLDRLGLRSQPARVIAAPPLRLRDHDAHDSAACQLRGMELGSMERGGESETRSGGFRRLGRSCQWAGGRHGPDARDTAWAMSEENVEIVRHSYEAGWKGDLEAALASYHPEVEVIDDPRVPGAKRMRGHAELKRYWESLSRYWESVRLEPERLVDLGDDVLVLGRMTARTRRGGPEIERALDLMATLREGKIIRLRLFSDRDEALEAVGLHE